VPDTHLHAVGAAENRRVVGRLVDVARDDEPHVGTVEPSAAGSQQIDVGGQSALEGGVSGTGVGGSHVKSRNSR
jgi:hypothetical protein